MIFDPFSTLILQDLSQYKRRAACYQCMIIQYERRALCYQCVTIQSLTRVAGFINDLILVELLPRAASPELDVIVGDGDGTEGRLPRDGVPVKRLADGHVTRRGGFWTYVKRGGGMATIARVS